MKNIKSLFKSNLLKITLLNSASVVLRISVGFITSKFIALFVGPAGMALVANFRNFMSSVQAGTSLGFDTGLVKYVAENKDNQHHLKKIIATIFLFVALLCCSISVVIFVLSDYLNLLIFSKAYNYSFIFKVFAFALPFYVGSVFLLSIINGLGCFKKVLLVNCIGYLIGLVVTILFIYYLQVTGALLSIFITPSLLFFISFYFMQTELKIMQFVKIQFFDFNIIKQFSSYTAMVLVSSIIGPLVFIIIRKNLIDQLGINAAGFWEAITRIASYYMLFITTILSLYFLPKLSAANSKRETNALFLNYFKMIMPLFGLGLLVLYFLRFFLIKLLLTNAFLPTEQLFFWQLLGDFFRAASYILAFQFYAKKLTKAFIISEIVSLTILYFSSIYLVMLYGFKGIAMAHCVTYIVYFIGLLLFFRKEVFLDSLKKLSLTESNNASYK